VVVLHASDQGVVVVVEDLVMIEFRLLLLSDARTCC
jgi:hypothetical protein